MAAEWIKFDKSTLDKPEVLAIAASLNQDPDFVIGKLLRMWSWFDTHTVSGNAPCVTAALLDSILRVTGFVSEVAKVGWLVIDSDGISLPHFDRHNGETAKQRALTAKRVAGFKAGNAKGNGRVTQQPLPRKEKKREEEQELPPTEGADAPPDPIFGIGLDFLKRKGVPERSARSFLGLLRKEIRDDLTVAALLGEAERQDVSDPQSWLTRAAKNHKANGASAKPPMAQQFADKTYTGTPDDELPAFLRADAR